jgi:uncharacterized protein
MMLAALGAIAIGLSLGMLGAGGSILTVPVLVFLVGQPEKLAVAQSLGIVGAIAGAGAIVQARRQAIDWRSVLLVGPPSMMGSYLGAWASQWINGRFQLLLFSAVMLIAGYRMFVSSKRTDELQAHVCRPGCMLSVGIGLGIMSGLVGVGGGFLIVPALVLLGGLAMSLAIGTSLVIISLSSFTGFAKQLHVIHALGLAIDWSIFGLFVALGVAGSLISNQWGKHLPQQHLKRIYSVFVMLMAGFIVWRIAAA